MLLSSLLLIPIIGILLIYSTTHYISFFLPIIRFAKFIYQAKSFAADAYEYAQGWGGGGGVLEAEYSSENNNILYYKIIAIGTSIINLIISK